MSLSSVGFVPPVAVTVSWIHTCDSAVWKRQRASIAFYAILIIIPHHLLDGAWMLRGQFFHLGNLEENHLFEIPPHPRRFFSPSQNHQQELCCNEGSEWPSGRCHLTQVLLKAVSAQSGRGLEAQAVPDPQALSRRWVGHFLLVLTFQNSLTSTLIPPCSEFSLRAVSS